MKAGFKRVPALDKCFAILQFLARSGRPLRISEISNALGYHKSTVFNTVYTLMDIGVLEAVSEKKFSFGPKLYSLGKVAGKSSELVSTIRPHLEEINQKTGLSVFLGIRSGLRAVIVDKVESPLDIKVSSETGMRIPLLAGAGGRVLLSQFSDEELDRVLKENRLIRFTSRSCVHKRQYKEMIKQARKNGFAFDDEEYIEGIRALAVPLDLKRKNLQAAIWVVGLKGQLKEEVIPSYRNLLKEIAASIESRFSFE